MDVPPFRMDGYGPPPDAPRDVLPNWDAFFASDPPPQMCNPDGTMGPPPMLPGGTPECPDDKNREGCPCYIPPGEPAPCWPGLRVNRDRGICRDGVTTCLPFDEFSGRWGPCVGYVLPDAAATRGPGTCNCFSHGTWELDNLSPCLVDYMAGRGFYAVSTFGDGMCPTSVSNTPPPSPQPGQPFSANRLTVDCAGQFELCFTIKAGSAMAPAPTDCTVARVCTEAWYGVAGEVQEFPPLPGWASTAADTVCVQRFYDSGGYAQMSVLGRSVECDAVDDGSGREFVFNTVGYCSFECNDHPMTPECLACMNGGSGMF